MAGRPPLPTNIKLLKGTLDRSRQNPKEPKVEPHIPGPPEYFSDLERRAWGRFAQQLDPLAVASDADFAALEMLVVTFCHHLRLTATLREKPLTYATETMHGKAMLRTRPELTALGDVDRRLLVLLGRFGLTPADRARVVSEVGQGADPDDEFAIS